MTTNEKFDQIYQTLVHENAGDMEVERKKAKVENRHNIIILTIIILINVVIDYEIIKLYDFHDVRRNDRNFYSYISYNIYAN